MLNLNKVLIIGNLVKKPEKVTTSQGQFKTVFVVATNRSWLSNGQRFTDVQFHRCVAWGSVAKQLVRLEKGQAIFIEGHLNHRKWDDQDGKKMYQTEIVVDKFGPVGFMKKESEDSDDENEYSNEYNNDHNNHDIGGMDDISSTDDLPDNLI